MSSDLHSAMLGFNPSELNDYLASDDFVVDYQAVMLFFKMTNIEKSKLSDLPKIEYKMFTHALTRKGKTFEKFENDKIYHIVLLGNLGLKIDHSTLKTTDEPIIYYFDENEIEVINKEYTVLDMDSLF